MPSLKVPESAKLLIKKVIAVCNQGKLSKTQIITEFFLLKIVSMFFDFKKYLNQNKMIFIM